MFCVCVCVCVRVCVCACMCVCVCVCVCVPPFVQTQRPHSGEMGAEFPVDSRTLYAQDTAVVEAGPVRLWGRGRGSDQSLLWLHTHCTHVSGLSPEILHYLLSYDSWLNPLDRASDQAVELQLSFANLATYAPPIWVLEWPGGKGVFAAHSPDELQSAQIPFPSIVTISLFSVSLHEFWEGGSEGGRREGGKEREGERREWGVREEGSWRWKD